MTSFDCDTLIGKELTRDIKTIINNLKVNMHVNEALFFFMYYFSIIISHKLCNAIRVSTNAPKSIIFGNVYRTGLYYDSIYNTDGALVLGISLLIKFYQNNKKIQMRWSYLVNQFNIRFEDKQFTKNNLKELKKTIINVQKDFDFIEILNINRKFHLKKKLHMLISIL